MTSATRAYPYAAPSSPADGRPGPAASGGRPLPGPAVALRFPSGVVTQVAPATAALPGVARAAVEVSR